MWKNYFDRIYLINLDKRPEKLAESATILSRYNIPFERYAGLDMSSGVMGLVKTMQKLFTECLQKGYNRVLVFEDDLDILPSVTKFHEVMNNVIEQMPIEYDLFYLGLNAARGFKEFYSQNILIPIEAYSTHAVIWNKSAMEFLITADIGEPLDMFLAKTIQKNNKTYCSYPMLVSQRVGYSDINKKVENWKIVLEHRYNKYVMQMAAEKNKTL